MERITIPVAFIRCPEKDQEATRGRTSSFKEIEKISLWAWAQQKYCKEDRRSIGMFGRFSVLSPKSILKINSSEKTVFESNNTRTEDFVKIKTVTESRGGKKFMEVGEYLRAPQAKRKLYFSNVYVKYNKKVIVRLKKLQVKKVLFHSVLKRNQMVQINHLQLHGPKLWNFLDGLQIRGRSGRTIIFKKRTNPPIAQFLGFLITDGCMLSTANTISLGQIDGGLVEKYLEIMNKEFCAHYPLRFDGKEGKISSNPLRFILNKYYHIPIGKKVRIVQIPLPILKTREKEVLKRFIAGIFDGDGCVKYYHLKNSERLDQVCFSVSTSSHRLVEQCAKILKKLGIKCSISLRRDDNRLTLQTSGFEEGFKFYVSIIPFIFHKKRMETANKIFLTKEFIGKLKIRLTPNSKKVFKEIRKNQMEGELLHKLSLWNYISSPRTIEAYTYPSNTLRVRSIFLYYACKLLRKDPSKLLPPDHLQIIERVENGHPN